MSERAHRRIVFAIALVLGLAGAACDGRDVDEVGEPHEPFVLMLSPAHGGTPEVRAQMASWLSAESGLVVTVEVAPSADAAVTSVGAAQGDAWLLPLFSYLFCVQEYGVEAGLQVVRVGGLREYQGEIVVRADSGIETAEALEGRKVAYVDPHSTSGFLLPAALLRGAGVTTEALFTGSHEAALEALRSGAADAAAVYHGATEGATDLRIVAQTRTVPNEPLFFRAGLDPALRQRFSDALVAYAATESGRAALSGMADIEGFAPITNADYATVGTVLNAADQDLEDLVPRGWLIHNQNQLTPVDYAP